LINQLCQDEDVTDFRVRVPLALGNVLDNFQQFLFCLPAQFFSIEQKFMLD